MIVSFFRITRVIEAGLIQYWHSIYAVHSPCGVGLHVSVSEKPISVDDVIYVLAVLAAGLAVGTLCLVCELAVGKTPAEGNRSNTMAS